MTKEGYSIYKFFEDNWDIWNEVSRGLEVLVPKIVSLLCVTRGVDTKYEFSSFFFENGVIVCELMDPDTQRCITMEFPESYLFAEDVIQAERDFTTVIQLGRFSGK